MTTILENASGVRITEEDKIVERNAAVCRPHSELHDVLSANALAIRARGEA